MSWKQKARGTLFNQTFSQTISQRDALINALFERIKFVRIKVSDPIGDFKLGANFIDPIATDSEFLNWEGERPAAPSLILEGTDTAARRI